LFPPPTTEVLSLQATIGYHKERLARSIKEFMGEDVLALVVKEPEWKSQLIAMREKHVRIN
jgi:hypothetical protein